MSCCSSLRCAFLTGKYSSSPASSCLHHYQTVVLCDCYSANQTKPLPSLQASNQELPALLHFKLPPARGCEAVTAPVSRPQHRDVDPAVPAATRWSAGASTGSCWDVIASLEFWQCFAVAGGWTQSLPTPTVLWVSPKMNSLFLLCAMIFLRAARKTCTATSDLILQETVIIVYSRLEVFVLYRLLGFPFLCHSTWVHKLLWVQLSKAKVKTCARNSKLFTVSNNAISSVIWNDRILLG